MGFDMVTEVSDVFQVKAQIVVEGLKLVWPKDFTQVEIDCDNAMLNDTIRNGFASISYITEVRLIHEWYTKDWKVKFRHVLRESNKVVDVVGKLNQLIILTNPSRYVRRLLEEDVHSSLHEEAFIRIHSSF
ncbi:hypothetical protein Godav_022187 [Gossypium davidsonii]|uniref:RNase H type-1 domain-containing protein n=2 Tax=Gossypium TaxID=3633 RepID=A0A7J8TAS9_GOSDV|nr:hypothetical protein [Gossypium davidsonii]